MPNHPDELTQLITGLSPEDREQILAQLRGPARLQSLAAELAATEDAVRADPSNPATADAYEQASLALREHRAASRPADRPIVGGGAVAGEES